MDILYLFFIFIFTFIFRIAIRLVYPRCIDSDTYFHLYFISHIKKYNKIKFQELTKFIKPSNFYYPWLTHQLLSKLPKRYEGILEKYINPLLDSIYVTILYIITLFITNSSEISLYLSLLYIFLPLSFTVQSIGPRVHSFTPRLFGEIVGSLVFVFEYFYFESQNYIYLILATIFVFLVILSSRFSFQAIVLISIVAFLFSFDFTIFIPILSGVALFLILYGKDGVELLKNHYFHIKIFYKNHREKKSFISGNNSFQTLINSIKSGSLIYIYTYFIRQNTFSSLILKAPLIILFLFLIDGNSFDNYQYIFAISGIIVFTIISIKPFLFLGEAERYINHIIFFILLICAQYLQSHNWILLLYILYGSLFFILDFIYLSKYLSKQYADNIIIRLNKLNKSYNVFSIPMNLSGSWRIAFETKHNLLHPVQWDNMKDRERFRSYFLKYEAVNINKIDEIVKEYNLDIIIIYKKLLQQKLKIPDGYKLEDFNCDVCILLKKDID